MNVKEIGTKLVEYCKAGDFDRVGDEFYSEQLVSVESTGEESVGMEETKKKEAWWTENHEIHSIEVTGPFPHQPDRFAVGFTFEITPKVGPMEGKRHTMNEVAVYTVAGGKIVRAEFFYDH